MHEFVAGLGVEVPPLERFVRLGDLTALRCDEAGRFYRANYERGILLYALVAAFRPASVLEFGTGRGYGCLCAAWAMADHELPARVFTIDMVAQTEAFEWPVDQGAGPVVRTLSRRDVWPRAAPREWTERIEILTGRTGDGMRRWNGPRVELAFIDAGHDYQAVRHDFYSALEVAADRFGILFDDYAPEPGFGVQRLIDEEVDGAFEAHLVYTDRRWPGGERAGLADPGYGMVWVHSDGLRKPLAEAFPPATRAAVIHRYRRWEQPRALRLRAGKAIRGLAGNGSR